MKILSSPAQHSAIVSRIPEYIESQIDNYLVYCVDEDVVGCCEIIQYGDGSAAEIASLAETNRTGIRVLESWSGKLSRSCAPGTLNWFLL